LLASDSSDLVMAMIHKFRETDLKETFPELNASPYILVMTDEAHRRSRPLLEPGPPGDSEGPAGEVRVAIGGLSKTAIDGRVTVGPDRLRSKRGKGKMACGGDPRRHGKVVPDCAAMMSRKDSRQALQPWYRAIGAAD